MPRGGRKAESRGGRKRRLDEGGTPGEDKAGWKRSKAPEDGDGGDGSGKNVASSSKGAATGRDPGTKVGVSFMHTGNEGGSSPTAAGALPATPTEVDLAPLDELRAEMRKLGRTIQECNNKINEREGKFNECEGKINVCEEEWKQAKDKGDLAEADMLQKRLDMLQKRLEMLHADKESTKGLLTSKEALLQTYLSKEARLESHIAEKAAQRSEGAAKHSQPGSSDELLKFLSSITESKEVDGCLVFEEPLFGKRRNGHKMVIRDHYSPILKRILELEQRPGTEGADKFVVTGTPGVGKSMFGLYLLRYFVVEEKVPVVYQISDRYFVLDKGKVFQIDSQSPWICAPGVVFISDPVKEEPTYLVGRMTIVLTSPDTGKFKQFIKQPASRKLIMPLCNDDEMERIRTNCFPKITEEEAKARAKLCGNEPRRVFAEFIKRPRLEDLEAEIEDACIQISSFDIFRSVVGRLGHYTSGADGKQHQLSFKVLCLDASQEEDGSWNYDDTAARMGWASCKVEQLFMKSHFKAVQCTLYRELAVAQGDSRLHHTASARGILFEGFVHTVLPKGGTFRMCKLVTPTTTAIKPTAIKLERLEVECFRQLTKVVPKEGVYYEPEKPNLKSIDSFFVHNGELWLIQITISLTHGLKNSGLKTCIQHVRTKFPGIPVRVVYVVPPDNLECFRVQNILTAKGAACKSPSKEATEAMDAQYALGLKLG